MDEHRWDERYKTGDLPWDTRRGDEHLVEIVKGYGIRPCRALEVGCGAGTNAIWLAEQGFDVTGVDVAPTAVAMAEERLAAAAATCRHRALPKSSSDCSFKCSLRCAFIEADVLHLDIPGERFGFVFDRGCFHSFRSDEERAALAGVVSRCLEPQGLWLSILGSADAPPRDTGPPRLTAAEIVAAVEERFEILLLRATRFGTNSEGAPPAWECLMRNRAIKTAHSNGADITSGVLRSRRS